MSKRNCAHGHGSKAFGWIVIIAAIIDAFVVECYPMWVRFRRKWYPMKSKSARKYFKRFLLFLRMLHLQKMLFLTTIFINTIPVQFEIDLFSLEIQYAFASVS